ncbi:MAG: hypothetical protein Rubg2KO_13350 [Rubricoccaceae bacterium]
MTHSGGAGGLTARWTRAAGGDGLSVGIEGGWIVDHQLVLGGTLLRTSGDPPLGAGAFGELAMTEGGILAAYHWAPERRVHPLGQFVVGAGAARLRAPDGGSLGRTAYLVAQPGLGLAVNVSDLVRFEGTAGTRLVLSRQLDDLHSSHLGGAFAQVSILIGVY